MPSLRTQRGDRPLADHPTILDPSGSKAGHDRRVPSGAHLRCPPL